MARRSLRGGSNWLAGVLVAGLWAGAGLPARAQFFPFFGKPSAPRAAPEPKARALTAEQVRAILAQEGARMIGRPQRSGRDIVAIGRDDAGARKRFTMDAVTGEIVDVTVLVRREAPPAAPGAGGLAPASPLPPPQHAPAGAATPVDANAAPSAPSSTGSTSRSSADDALSPIRPQHPRGAPKVEPLPNQ
ncbi:hypothetical protein [Rhodoblastus sp.]|uniref:hypothetical protein n=1 Tax=Rhodoblastus sp. TaxID=1962975 RepID=UPI0026360623|nr:hypothetical protein [Rhodoblastus sp.]